MIADDVKCLKELLCRMRTEDTDLRVFGANLHKYSLGPTLSEYELKAFEQKHGITLPPDYRLFLKEAGNGKEERSDAPIIAINAGAGPGYGLLPLEETSGECDPKTPFPLTQSTDVQMTSGAAQAAQKLEDWEDEEPCPGVLQIAYHGCAFFSYLVVNGPAYGTVWDADMSLNSFFATGLSFAAWCRRWTDMLRDRALPMFARERIVGQVHAGMTLSHIVGICGGEWQRQDFGEGLVFLRFEHLATQFQLDANDVVNRIVCHRI